MLKYTERVGDLEQSYEGATVQDIVNLKKALNPSILIAKESPKETRAESTGGATWMKEGAVS